jgi:hypothetical protein
MVISFFYGESPFYGESIEGVFDYTNIIHKNKEIKGIY